MYSQLLIIHHDHVEYFEDSVEHLFVQNVIVVEGGLVAVVNEVLDELALLEHWGHFVDLLRSEGGEQVL